jgi:ABC-type transport system involved in cytochrome c biogenesis permease component
LIRLFLDPRARIMKKLGRILLIGLAALVVLVTLGVTLTVDWRPLIGVQVSRLPKRWPTGL